MFHASPSGSLGTLFLLPLSPWWSLQSETHCWRVGHLRGRFRGSDMDEKQRKQKKHILSIQNLIKGAPAWLTKSDLTVFNLFLLVLRAVINATMYERLGGHETIKSMSTTWVLSRSVSLKDPKITTFSPTTSLWPLKTFFDIIWTNLVGN